MPCSSSHLRSHSSEEKPLSARKASCPSERTRNSPTFRSSQFAGAKPKAVTTPSGLTERATLKPYTHSVLETLRPKLACPANRPLRHALPLTIAGTRVVSSTR